MRTTVPLLVLAGTLGVQAQKYDFVIAGAGTAGLVLAARLSEDSSINVAVIEPGPDVRDNADVQALDFSFSDYNASINWIYNTIPQPQLNGRTLPYRAGKAVGGTSIVNGNIFPSA
jgi:choline dehydrogenase